MRWIIPLCLALCAGPASAAARFSKIMIVVFENTDYPHALGRPFFGKLAKEGALLAGYYAVAHPSQPNYIALVAGDTMGVSSDRNATLDALNLADLLEAN